MAKMKQKLLFDKDELTLLMIYRWIGENIELDCSKAAEDDDLEYDTTVYNKGKGTAKGIAKLFATMVKYINIESGIISGISRTFQDPDEFVQIHEHYWNYILLNKEYYLIDVSKSIGICHGLTGVDKQLDLFFGTYPEIFIRYNYPDDSKWQLLPKNITKEQFVNQAFLTDCFYLLNITSISPDSLIIDGKKDTEIILTYNESSNFSDNISVHEIYSNEQYEIIKNFKFKKSKGKITISVDLSNEKIKKLAIAFPFNGPYYIVEGSPVIYKINHSKKKQLMKTSNLMNTQFLKKRSYNFLIKNIN